MQVSQRLAIVTVTSPVKSPNQSPENNEAFCSNALLCNWKYHHELWTYSKSCNIQHLWHQTATRYYNVSR